MSSEATMRRADVIADLVTQVSRTRRALGPRGPGRPVEVRPRGRPKKEGENPALSLRDWSLVACYEEARLSGDSHRDAMEIAVQRTRRLLPFCPASVGGCERALAFWYPRNRPHRVIRAQWTRQWTDALDGEGAPTGRRVLAWCLTFRFGERPVFTPRRKRITFGGG